MTKIKIIKRFLGSKFPYSTIGDIIASSSLCAQAKEDFKQSNCKKIKLDI